MNKKEWKRKKIKGVIDTGKCEKKETEGKKRKRKERKGVEMRRKKKNSVKK